MKISELNTQSFLGGTNVPANSYVLINYAENGSADPVTKKVSIQELGKAIANDQQLYKKTSGGAVTTSVSNGAYANGTAEKLVTASEKNFLSELATNDRAVRTDNNLTLTIGGARAVPNVLLHTTGYQGADVIGYYSSNSSESFTPLEIGGGSGSAPTDIEIDDTGYNYVFYDVNSKEFCVYNSDMIESIPLDPYTADISGSCAYAFINEYHNLIVGDQNGVDKDYGKPLFYIGDHSFGYYDDIGSFIAVMGISGPNTK